MKPYIEYVPFPVSLNKIDPTFSIAACTNGGRVRKNDVYIVFWFILQLF